MKRRRRWAFRSQALSRPDLHRHRAPGWRDGGLLRRHQPFRPDRAALFLRSLAGTDNVRVIPLCALAGAVLLNLADIAARIVMAPEDMPVSVVMGLASSIAVIFILRRS